MRRGVCEHVGCENAGVNVAAALVPGTVHVLYSTGSDIFVMTNGPLLVTDWYMYIIMFLACLDVCECTVTL